MLEKIIKRTVMFFLVVIASTALVFFMLHSLPGESAEVMAKYIFLGNVELTPSNEAIDIIKEKYDLQKPLLSQYITWMGNAIQGDLGKSFQTNDPVTEEILIRLPATLLLAFSSIALSLVIGIPAGILAAIKQNSFTDYFCSTISVLGISIPSFWLAILLIFVFSYTLGLTPTMGYGEIKNLILPAIALGTPASAVITRLMRSSMLEVMRQDYIRTAIGKGLGYRMIILRHALKNTFIPVITIIGLEFGHLLGGTVIIETIFAWPGIGRLLVTSISARDVPVIQGCIVFITITYLVINFVTDISYSYLDPRIGRSKN
ncbi:MAG: nickel transporter permease NikB [Methanomethylovorans sp. PtaU1.Bin073]|jgi:peptide/nickel transport system permease protein|nr:MAG: nickel transporter permease NikB [Methanomethylovorans sp. PtaU1.Bin073]